MRDMPRVTSSSGAQNKRTKHEKRRKKRRERELTECSGSGPAAASSGWSDTTSTNIGSGSSEIFRNTYSGHRRSCSYTYKTLPTSHFNEDYRHQDTSSEYFNSSSVDGFTPDLFTFQNGISPEPSPWSSNSRRSQSTSTSPHITSTSAHRCGKSTTIVRQANHIARGSSRPYHPHPPYPFSLSQSLTPLDGPRLATSWSQPKYKASPSPCAVPLPSFVLTPKASLTRHQGHSSNRTTTPIAAGQTGDVVISTHLWHHQRETKSKSRHHKEHTTRQLLCQICSRDNRQGCDDEDTEGENAEAQTFSSTKRPSAATVTTVDTLTPREALSILTDDLTELGCSSWSHSWSALSEIHGVPSAACSRRNDEEDGGVGLTQRGEVCIWKHEDLSISTRGVPQPDTANSANMANLVRESPRQLQPKRLGGVTGCSDPPHGSYGLGLSGESRRPSESTGTVMKRKLKKGVRAECEPKDAYGCQSGGRGESDVSTTDELDSLSPSPSPSSFVRGRYHGYGCNVYTPVKVETEVYGAEETVGEYREGTFGKSSGEWLQRPTHSELADNLKRLLWASS